MFGIGFPELVVIFVIGLIVLGPEQLPKVARQIARFVNDLKHSAEEFKREFDVDDVTDLKLLDRLEDLSELEQAKRPPGGLGGEWKEAKGPLSPSEKDAEKVATGESEVKAEEKNSFVDQGPTVSTPHVPERDNAEDKDEEGGSP